MLNTILSLFRATFLIFGGHEQVALENLAPVNVNKFETPSFRI